MDGLRLCLDPRRHAPGYEGTGYRGVTEDFWPSGFKARKPFTMVHAGKYHGRFATKEEADEEVMDILDMYSKVYEHLLAVPVVAVRVVRGG